MQQGGESGSVLLRSCLGVVVHVVLQLPEFFEVEEREDAFSGCARAEARVGVIWRVLSTTGAGV